MDPTTMDGERRRDEDKHATHSPVQDGLRSPSRSVGQAEHILRTIVPRSTDGDGVEEGQRGPSSQQSSPHANINFPREKKPASQQASKHLLARPCVLLTDLTVLRALRAYVAAR